MATPGQLSYQVFISDPVPFDVTESVLPAVIGAGVTLVLVNVFPARRARDLLAVLVVIYVYNIKALPLWTGEQISFLLVNVISFLNLGLAGFVLAAIAARFLFPAVSLEGRTLWLLKSSPLDLRSLLWTRYWVGVTPLVILAVALTVGTNIILRVGSFMMALSVATIILMTFGIASLALGFGALFPRFETDNAAEISTGFGGLLFMMRYVQTS